MSKRSKAEITRLAHVDPRLRCCYDDARYTGICAPLGMQREVLLKRVAEEVPGNNRWRWAEVFFDEPNPYPCPDDPRRHHVLLEKL